MGPNQDAWQGQSSPAKPEATMALSFASATDLAIACAMRRGDLRLVKRASRFGGEFIAIEDGCGLIEVQNSAAEAEARIAAIGARL